MNYKDINDYEMLYLIGEKDEEAERILYGKYRNLIIKLAPKFLPYVTSRGGEFDDLIQEGYIGLYSAIKNYELGNKTLFYTFARICIERQMSTYCRRLSSCKQEVLNYSYSLDVKLDDVRDPFSEVIASSADDPCDALIVSGYVEKIIEFKNSLSFDMALIFELRFNGFSYQEICSLLDIKKSKVDSALSQIRLKLKRSGIRKELQKV